MIDLHKLTYAIVIIGALNWGAVGLFGYNIAESAFGFNPNIVKLVYIVVGVSALVELTIYKDISKISKVTKKTN